MDGAPSRRQGSARSSCGDRGPSASDVGHARRTPCRAPRSVASAVTIGDRALCISARPSHRRRPTAPSYHIAKPTHQISSFDGTHDGRVRLAEPTTAPWPTPGTPSPTRGRAPNLRPALVRAPARPRRSGVAHMQHGPRTPCESRDPCCRWEPAECRRSCARNLPTHGRARCDAARTPHVFRWAPKHHPDRAAPAPHVRRPTYDGGVRPRACAPARSTGGGDARSRAPDP